MAVVSARYHQTSVQISEEAHLIAEAKNDISRFEPLYNKYYRQILEFVYQRMDSLDDAYDITSQVFLAAMQNLKRYEHRGLPFSSWLYRIAINELNKWFRKNKKYRTVNIDTTQLTDVLTEMKEDDAEDKKQRLVLCLKKLSSADYLMIEMRFFEGRPFKEIGDILEITENNAKVKTYRAIDKLRRHF